MTGIQRTGGILVLGLVLLGAYASLTEFLGAVFWQGMFSHVQRWQADPARLQAQGRIEQWHRLEGYAQQAEALQTDNPQLLETLAALNLWGAWTHRDQPERSNSLYEKGLDRYRRAIEVRPLFPETWIYLARAKHWRQQWDTEFQQAYATAWKLGGWRIPTIEVATDLGFSAWRHLNPENQQNFYQAMRRAALRKPGWLKRKAAEHGRTYLLCIKVEDSPSISRHCARKGFELPHTQAYSGVEG